MAVSTMSSSDITAVPGVVPPEDGAAVVEEAAVEDVVEVEVLSLEQAPSVSTRATAAAAAAEKRAEVEIMGRSSWGSGLVKGSFARTPRIGCIDLEVSRHRSTRAPAASAGGDDRRRTPYDAVVE